MFYVDGNFLDASASGKLNEEYRELRKRFLESGEFEWPIRILSRRGRKVNPTGMREPEKFIHIPTVSTVDDNEGSHEWRYTKARPPLVKGVPKFDERVTLGHEIVIDKADVDLAIFLILKSQHCVRTGQYYVKDRKKEADDYAKKKAMLSGVGFILYDDSSFLNNDDVKTLALALGISNADSDKYSINEVKQMIEQKVVQGETTGDKHCNYKVFKDYARVDQRVKLLAAVQKMYDENIVRYDRISGKFSYMVEGQIIDTIFQIAPIDEYRKDILFLQFLDRNDYWHEVLFTKLGYEVEEQVIDAEYLGKLEFKMLCTVAKQHGVVYAGKKRELVEKEILEKLGKPLS